MKRSTTRRGEHQEVAMNRYFDAELYHDDTWEVYDPGTAKTIALFYDKELAEDYLRWLNKKKKIRS
jgi:hypothetical protein